MPDNDATQSQVPTLLVVPEGDAPSRPRTLSASSRSGRSLQPVIHSEAPSASSSRAPSPAGSMADDQSGLVVVVTNRSSRRNSDTTSFERPRPARPARSRASSFSLELKESSALGTHIALTKTRVSEARRSLEALVLKMQDSAVQTDALLEEAKSVLAEMTEADNTAQETVRLFAEPTAGLDSSPGNSLNG